jgi:hypothetical protein
MGLRFSAPGVADPRERSREILLLFLLDNPEQGRGKRAVA